MARSAKTMVRWPALGRAGPLGPPSTMVTLPIRSKLPHDTPAWVPDGSVFFVTICCQNRDENQLCRPAVAACLFEALEFRIKSHHWHVELFLLMPDHLHALISVPADREMRKIIASFKEMTAKQVGVRWQRDFFDHRVRSEHEYLEKAAYIRANPLRKKLMSAGDVWPWMWTSMSMSGGPRGPALPKEVHV